ncbi:uncharacterized protein LOC141926717 isoform X4 [Strix aluco]|uniref:uncharacterized protein LOC141926717 isoform X4 n=1 Tax=Strix aluco TaxID=111821 RepID=UPI003DA63D28
MAEVILIKEVKVKADAGMEITVERGPTHKSEALIPGGIHRLPLCGDISPFSPIKLLAGCCLGGAVEQTLGSSKCWCIWKYSERWAGGRRPPTHPQNSLAVGGCVFCGPRFPSILKGSYHCRLENFTS